MTVGRKFRACLFDMDGLLIDSEKVYTISFSEVLVNLGIKQGLTWDLKSKLQGLPGVEACQVVIDFHNLKGKITAEEFFKQTSARQEQLWNQVELLPGVEKLINYLHTQKVPICVCTSSDQTKYVQKTKQSQPVFELFQGNVITGDNPTIKGKGKPLPFIWWLGLDTLNSNLSKDEEQIKPEECLIFEDAIPGFISGKRAGGYVIWVPDPNALALLDQKQVVDLVGFENEYGIVLNSLEDLDLSKYGL